jgi:hypothetical protein
LDRPKAGQGNTTHAEHIPPGFFEQEICLARGVIASFLAARKGLKYCAAGLAACAGHAVLNMPIPALPDGF